MRCKGRVEKVDAGTPCGHNETKGFGWLLKRFRVSVRK
jgi:hypothetical protein